MVSLLFTILINSNGLSSVITGWERQLFSYFLIWRLLLGYLPWRAPGSLFTSPMRWHHRPMTATRGRCFRWGDGGVLKILVFLPVFGAALVAIMPASRPVLLWRATMAFALAVLGYVLWLATQFDPAGAAVQMFESRAWNVRLGSYFALGIDGVSLAMVLLTALLTLIPLFFLIERLGGPNRQRAALNFFLYTLGGPVFMLVALLFLYDAAPGHSFAMADMADMAEGGRSLPLNMQLLIFAGLTGVQLTGCRRLSFTVAGSGSCHAPAVISSSTR